MTGNVHPYVPPSLLCTPESDAMCDRVGQDVDRLNLELSLAHRNVKVERDQVAKLASVLNHEQGIRENLERDILALREQVKLYAEWRVSDGNTILALTKENERLTAINDELSDSLRRAG